MPVFYKKEKYVLIQIESLRDWDDFDDVCDGYLNARAFVMLRDYLKGSAKTIVLEKEYCDTDYRDTFYNFFARKFAKYPSTAMRANFFDCKISPRMIYDLDRYNSNYIGFCVIRPNRVAPIGRTILNPQKLSCVPGYVCMAEYPVHILGAELIARGFPYLSQDTDVTICAHAACWMVFRYFSQRYSRYAETWPYELTQLTQDLSFGRLVPSRGLTIEQVTEMFSRFGFYPETYFRDVAAHKPIFEKLLYHYIESGLPVVAGLYKHGHAITIIGHASDFSIPIQAPEESDQYITALIANDDNCMPYQAIRTRSSDPRPSGHWSKYSIEEIDSFVVPLYEKIHLSAKHARKLIETVLASEKFGVSACSKLINRDQLITRTFLTSSKSYKKFRRKEILPFGISKVYVELPMPKFIWICEISTPELYANGQVIGELLFDATANHHDRLSFLIIHYPDFLLLNDRNCLTDDEKRFTVPWLDTSTICPYRCYINNLREE